MEPNKKKSVFEMPNGKTCYVENTLRTVFDSVVYNITKDWDFVFLVTGNRMVRTGKSVLAMNCGAYLAHRINQLHGTGFNFSSKNIFFDSQDMMTAAHEMPKHSVLIYDEARESLAASKSMTALQQDVLDFFNEVGQLNHIFILVLPDFFILKEEIAVARSEGLINVYREKHFLEKDLYGTGEKTPITRFGRGQYAYYHRENKQLLYDRAKSMRRKAYNLVKPKGYGRFTNNYPINEEEYRQKKRDALIRFKEAKENKAAANNGAGTSHLLRENLIKKLYLQHGNASRVARELEYDFDYKIDPVNVRRVVRKLKSENKINEIEKVKTNSQNSILF